MTPTSQDLTLFDLDTFTAPPALAAPVAPPITTTVLDGFAGPGGWDVAMTWLGLTSHGIENDPSARATRAAFGHITPWSDMWDGADPILSAALRAGDYHGE